MAQVLRRKPIMVLFIDTQRDVVLREKCFETADDAREYLSTSRYWVHVNRKFGAVHVELYSGSKHHDRRAYGSAYWTTVETNFRRLSEFIMDLRFRALQRLRTACNAVRTLLAQIEGEDGDE